MNPLHTFSSTLPYRLDALEPVLSRETVQYHLVQHHCQCYERTAAIVKGTDLESLSLESLVRFTGTQPGYRYLFTLAAEAWNHDLYWRSLRPGAGGVAWGPVGEGVRRSFGSFAAFLRRATATSAAVFGSGWLWVTWRGGEIEITTTGKTDSPIVHGHAPLLAIDLWEHAYYLDYYNARVAYVSACLKELIDWERANERLLHVKGNPLEGKQHALAWNVPGVPKALAEKRSEARDSAPTAQARQRVGIACTGLREIAPPARSSAFEVAIDARVDPSREENPGGVRLKADRP